MTAPKQGGLRIRQTTYNPTTGLADETTAFLFDNQNHTGDAQALEQTVRTSGGAAQQITKQLAFILGLDVTAQATLAFTNGVAGVPGVHHLLYDAHGSTRALADALG